MDGARRCSCRASTAGTAEEAPPASGAAAAPKKPLGAARPKSPIRPGANAVKGANRLASYGLGATVVGRRLANEVRGGEGYEDEETEEEKVADGSLRTLTGYDEHPAMMGEDDDRGVTRFSPRQIFIFTGDEACFPHIPTRGVLPDFPVGSRYFTGGEDYQKQLYERFFPSRGWTQKRRSALEAKIMIVQAPRRSNSSSTAVHDVSSSRREDQTRVRTC